jgi:Sec7-like guanine-nucleotide exchange factor
VIDRILTCFSNYYFRTLQASQPSTSVADAVGTLHPPAVCSWLQNFLAAREPTSASTPAPLFSNEDSVCVLSYALLMLNTSLFNPNVHESEKMTLPQFISMNRGIDGGKNLDPGLLSQVYAAIEEEEIKVHAHTHTHTHTHTHVHSCFNKQLPTTSPQGKATFDVSHNRHLW